MDKHTYYVGAKPAIERAMRRFERSRVSLDVQIDPLTRSFRTIRLRGSVPDAADGDGPNIRDWPVAGMPTTAVGVRAFRSLVRRSVRSYGANRAAKAGDALCRLGLRDGAEMPTDVFRRCPCASGEA